jgi:hypothetical protein
MNSRLAMYRRVPSVSRVMAPDLGSGARHDLGYHEAAADHYHQGLRLAGALGEEAAAVAIGTNRAPLLAPANTAADGASAEPVNPRLSTPPDSLARVGDAADVPAGQLRDVCAERVRPLRSGGPVTFGDGQRLLAVGVVRSW